MSRLHDNLIFPYYHFSNQNLPVITKDAIFSFTKIGILDEELMNNLLIISFDWGTEFKKFEPVFYYHNFTKKITL